MRYLIHTKTWGFSILADNIEAAKERAELLPIEDYKIIEYKCKKH